MTHLAMVFSREGLRAATSNDFDCDSLYAIKISLRFRFLYFRAWIAYAFSLFFLSAFLDLFVCIAVAPVSR